MPAIHVRDLDDAVIEALKRRAARKNRSLQGELRDILERVALRDAAGRPAGRRRKLRIRTVAVGGPVYTRETIYDD